jgi:hypothetical protein
VNQPDLFAHPQLILIGNSVLWDGQRVHIDEAIKLCRFRVELAPSFPAYQRALDALLEAKKGMK